MNDGTRETSCMDFCRSMSKKYQLYANAGDITDTKSRRGGRHTPIIKDKTERRKVCRLIVRRVKAGVSWERAVKGTPYANNSPAARAQSVYLGLYDPKANQAERHAKRLLVDKIARKVNKRAFQIGLSNAIKGSGITVDQYRGARERLGLPAIQPKP